VDALSDILAAIWLDGAVYVKAKFKAPWCVQTQYGLPTAASRLPRSDHIVFFHLPTDGSCLARLTDGSEELEVTAGDLLLFPHDHRHILGTDLTLSPAPVGSEPLDAPPVPHVVIGCALWQMS
jgi:AraC family transcriptional regulator, alkane utilization regulator